MVSATADRFYNFNGASSNSQSLDSQTYNIVPFACDVKKLTVSVFAAPGAGNTRETVLRKNGSSTALTATLGAADLTKQDNVNVVTLAADDLVNWMTTPVSNPSAPTRYRMGAVVYIAPAVGGGSAIPAMMHQYRRRRVA